MTSVFAKPSLTTRIGIGKLIGFLIGLLGFWLMPIFAPEVGMHFRLGALLWYTTVGAVIGVFGVYSEHPVLHLPTPWWVRAPVIGAWMNFVVSLFAFEQLKSIMTAMGTLAGSPLTSPFWFVLEGAVIGLLIGGIATKLGGEGPDTVKVSA